MLSKPGHRCTAAACLPDGSWSRPLCVADVDPGCEVSALGVPGGASIATEACVSGSEVTSGGVCEFSKPGHVCSAASCVAGTWSAGMCVPMAGCMFSALEMPSGASGSGGDEKCSSDAVEPVPEDGTCVVSKADHQCNAAICTSGGEWSNVVCVPSSNPGCQVSEIVAPDGAEVSTEECMSSTEVSSGTTCGFAKAGHVCSSASCVGYCH